MLTTVLKPGLLVALNTTIRGGVNYRKTELEPEHRDEAGALVARWETLREIENPEEFERAKAARSRARALVASICCPSSFGLLCPQAREGELLAAVEAAREVAQAHNALSRLTRIDVYVLVGRVARDDAEAARAIAAELRGLMEQMQAGIAAADPEAIREAASKARALGGMLDETVSGRVDAAITEARRAAREIVKRVEKAGEAAAGVVAQCSTAAIETARFAFLDLDAGEAPESEAPGARGLDLEPAPAMSAPATGPATRTLEF